MFSVQSLHNLSSIYKDLYKAISEIRPSIEDQYQRIHDQISRWEWDIVHDCGVANKEIRATMVFVEEQLDWINQQKVLSDEQRLFMLGNLYRLIYSHANYWYVLIDGVVFEGLVETLSELLIKKVAAALQRSELDILSNLIEPLTDYQYIAVSREREQSAQDMLLMLQSRNHQLYLEVDRFIQTYSRIKEYQPMFGKLQRTFFEPIIPRCHKEVVNLIEQMDIRELSTEDRMPWNFLPLLWNNILPTVLAKRCSTS